MQGLVLVDFYSYVIYSLLLCILTGFPLALALRRNHEDEFGLLELIYLSLIIGYFVPPIISVTFATFFNMLVSYQTSLLIRLAVFLLPLFFLFFEISRENNKLSFRFSHRNFVSSFSKLYEDTKNSITILFNDLKNFDLSRLLIYSSYFIFVFASIAVFILLLSRYSAVGFELDPYFYLYGMKNLVNLGYIPLTEDTAFYPDNQEKVVDSHRTGALMNYAIFDLFVLVYQKLKSNVDTIYDIVLAANLYPPLMHVFLVFVFFMIFKNIKIEIAGAVAAIAAFLPRLIESLSPVEFQLEPIGVFGTIFILYAFLRVLNKTTIQSIALLAIAIGITLLGSKSAIMIHFPIIWTYILILFLKSFKIGSNGFSDELIRLIIPFVVYSLVYLLFLSISVFYQPNFNEPKNPVYDIVSFLKRVFLDSDTLFILLTIFFASALLLIDFLLKSQKLKIQSTTALVVLYLLGFVFFIVEFGKFQELGRSLLGQFTYFRALERTIAEQNLSGDMIEPFFGFVGLSLKNTPFEFLFSIFNETFNMILVLTITLLNVVFNLTVPIAIVTLSTTLFTFFYVIALIYLLIYKKPYLMDNDFKRFDSFFYLLVLVLMLTLFLITLIKVKYHVYLAIIFVLVFGVFMIAYYSFLEFLLKTQIFKFLNLNVKDIETYSKVALALLVIIIPALQYFEVSNTPIAIHTGVVYALKPKFSDNPILFSNFTTKLCTLTRDKDICRISLSKNLTVIDQYQSNLCFFSQFDDVNNLLTGRANISQKVYYMAARRCSFIPEGWLELYEWMKDNVPKEERITSWWDYGHWTNYFGERKSVLRNDHLSHDMILEIAHAYVMANESELVEIMRRYNSSYAIFDIEIAFGGNQFGGKYNALNYLACARNNLTDYTKNVGISECEELNRWDTLLVPENARQCEISLTDGKKGIVGFLATESKSINVCVDANTFEIYYLNVKDEFGDLKKIGSVNLYGGDEIINQQGLKMRLFSVGYNDPKVIQEVQTKHRFYNSNIYKAFVLEKLENFELVFKSTDGIVKVYKIKN